MTQHAWTPGYFRLFISHISARKEMAGALREGLWDHHIDAFVAHEDIAPTALWQEEIEDALATCDGCVAILSDGFNESKWCDQEVGFCFGRDVLVLSLGDGLAPYGFIGKFQGFNPRKYADDKALYEAIYEVLRDNPRSRNPMASALVQRYEDSGNFAAAKRNVDLLKSIPTEAWTAELLDRVDRAHEENGQIAGAYYGTGTVNDVAVGLVKSIRRQAGPGASATTAGSGSDGETELLAAALSLKDNIDELRRRIAHAVRTGKYWRHVLVWNVFETYKDVLMKRPDVYEPVSDAYLWFRELNENVTLAAPIPAEDEDDLKAGIGQLEHAIAALRDLITELSAPAGAES